MGKTTVITIEREGSMMGKVLKLIFMVLFMGNLVSCDLVNKVAIRAEKINNFERVSLKLAQENRLLKAKVNQLEFNLEKARAQSEYLNLQLKHPGKPPERTPASIKSGTIKGADLVKQEIFKWNDSQLKAAAIREYEQQNFEKSAQFFHILLQDFADSKELNDQTLYQAGVAAYHSGKHYDWSQASMERLIKTYPESNHYLSAKMWLGLSHLKNGNSEQFWSVVEEFRKKYRNTAEWKLMSKYYDRMATKYHH